MQEGFNPGDKVVALAAAARTAAIVAGAVSGTIAMWIARHRPAMSGIGFLGGAVAGWLLGTLIGKTVFSAPAGSTRVAKAGLASLPLTLKGNLSATIVTGVAVTVLVVLVTQGGFKAVAPLSVGAAVLIGILFALLSSLW